MVILGIDPGTTRIGYGLIRGGKKPELITCGLLQVSGKEPGTRRLQAAAHFEKLINKHHPQIVAVEKLFFVNNQKTGLAVSEMRGALLLIAERSGAKIAEYAPTEIKKIVAGFGGADKKAVAKMVRLSLAIAAIPGPDDVSDALAAALAAAYAPPDEK